jgi:hypothetical protein
MPRTPAPQGWHDRAKAQLFAPLYWTARGLRALSVTLFSLVAIAFVLAQIAPDLFEKPVSALAGVIGDLLGRPPLWVWFAVAIGGIAIWISLRLQRRLDRQVDEAVGDLSGWIPNDRLRNWLGVEPETDVDSLGETAKRLAQSVTAAQQVRAADRQTGMLNASLGLLRLHGPGDEGEAARVGSLAGATEELSTIIQQIAKVGRTLIILEGPGAADAASAFAFTAGLPACDVLVEGNAGSADARVLIGEWTADRLFELLLRRAPAGVEVPEWAARGAPDSAGGNPREAIRRFRLAITAAAVLEQAEPPQV